MAKEIPMCGRNGDGLYALVSDHRYDEVMKYKWSVRFSDTTWYAKTKVKNASGKRYDLLMHRLILGLTDSEVFGEHINGHGWDNRDENLRPATTGQNQHNRGSNRDATSKYKGVSWNSQYQKWFARIAVDNEEKFIGVFEDEKEAAYSVDTYSRIYHKEFARLNFPNVHWTIEDVQHARYYYQTKTGYIGVTKNKRGYIARLNVGNERIYLGWFEDPIEAAKARDAAIIRYGLKNRRLNFQEDYPNYAV